MPEKGVVKARKEEKWPSERNRTKAGGRSIVGERTGRTALVVRRRYFLLNGGGKLKKRGGRIIWTAIKWKKRLEGIRLSKDEG